MATAPRILTFNFHEPYVCLMAKTGLHLFVGEYENPPLARPWHTQYRAVPKNVVLLEEAVWRRDLMAGKFDVAIAHNETNAFDIFRAPCPKLLACHNRKTFLRTTVTENREETMETFDRLLQKLRDQFGFVFISATKRDDYGVPGRVILPGIDVDEYGGYTGTEGEILRVGNMMRERDLMFDVAFQERVCCGLPNRVAGDNPTILGAKAAASFEDLLDKFRRLRCLLHVTREEWEDGYNLSMLEAMACGSPVIALANRTSPLTDGKDGFVSYNAGVLHKRARELLADRDLARAIGARGRETVAEKFPLEAFTTAWREAIETAAKHSPRRRALSAARTDPEAKGSSILLHYLSSPVTTGRYFERAARKRFNVMTVGFRCPEDVLDLWGFPTPPPAYPAHDIDVPLESTCAEIRERIPEDFTADLYLWIDSGPKVVPPDLHLLEMLKACYLIDTHIAPDLRMNMARHFDYTFLAQQAQVGPFLDAGLRNVAWLPLGCSPELHDVGPLERTYDVGFICHPRGDHTDRRRNMMRALSERFPNSRIGQCWPDEMAQAYAQSKIVVNACINRDVNMRVFEALASGALLITDEAEGLEDLFEDGVHLVVYRNDEDVLGLVERYLADDEARERIAAAGCAFVHEKHTYDHRMAELAALIAEGRGEGRGAKGDGRFQLGGYFRLRRAEMIEHVPRGAARVLDVGCGAGDFGQQLKKRGEQQVVGIELNSRACAMAKEVLDDALEGNIETMDLPFEDGRFDCIVFSDVLEHLIDPTAALRRASRVLASDGVVLMSIPNVRYYEVVQMLINGRWQYLDAGIMDRNHVRFFTATEIREMIARAGLVVADIEPLWAVSEDKLPRNPDGTVSLNRATIGPFDDEEYRDLLTYQYVAAAVEPGADRLAKARLALDGKKYELAYGLAREAYSVDEAERRRIMAKAVAKLGKLDDAETLYREALDLTPDDAAIKSDLGILCVAMNRPAEAKSFLEQALRDDPTNDRARGALGLVYMGEGAFEPAFACFREAIEARVENRTLVAHLIRAADSLDQLADVEDLVERCVGSYPDDSALAYAHAALLAQLGKTRDARTQLEALLERAPDHQPARQLLDSLNQTA